jgi:hypothetical protein
MKIALILFGHMRTYEQCFQSLKENFLDHYDVDVYMHTWNTIESETKSWHDRHMHNRDVPLEEWLKIKKMYSLKKIDIGTQVVPEVDGVIPGSSLSYLGQKYMAESMKKAMDLIDPCKYDEYDLVVKMRPDIKLLSKLDLFVPDSDVVLIAGNRTCSEMSQDPSKYRACDIINACSPEAMKKICDVYEDFDKYFVENIENNESTHSAFVDNIWDCDLKIEFIDYRYNKQWTIIREASK